MSDIVFRSPNTFETETDLSGPVETIPSGVPAGVIGTALKGPAFVPVTVGSFSEFQNVFGGLDSKKFGPYAVNEFLKHRSSLTYLRVLGAGSTATAANIETSRTTGRTVSAGVKIEGSAAPGDAKGRHVGCVQFLAARHALQANEALGMPMFTDNDSFVGSNVNLVRGLVMMASGARMMVLDGNQSAVNAFTSVLDDAAAVSSGKVKIAISSSLGSSFSTTDGNAGVRIFTASFDPTQDDYFAKVLNTNPDRFAQEQHFLYADFAVDNELASPTAVAVLSGSANTSPNSGESSTPFRNAYGAFDARYTSPTTTWFISQPFGATEHDLFRVEALDDGEYANTLYKVTIAGINASLDDSNPYGTFTVLVRDWNDSDANPIVLEQFANCSLDPDSDNYVAKLIGDRRVTFNFDATVDSDKRVITFGKYENRSQYVRVVMSDKVERKLVPPKSLPFGFRGLPLLKTNDALTDTAPSSANARVVGVLQNTSADMLSGSILPPVPYRFKITRGEVSTAGAWAGQPGVTEQASNQYCWGIKFERNTNPLNPNVSTEQNDLLSSYSKFLGIAKLDVLVTGSGADTLNNNKFTLAKVALSNQSLSDLTASVATHMREAAYVRDGALDPTTYTLNDGTLSKRVTLATILAQQTPADFNRWSVNAKFTNMLCGGYDGVNFLDKNAREMNDRAASMDAGGGAEASYVAPGLLINPAGTGQSNSTIMSYATAIDIMTDPQGSTINLLGCPGIREPYVTDRMLLKAREYGLAFAVIDIPSYDDDGARLFDDSSSKPSVDQTANALDDRAIDNSYGAPYWPNVIIDDGTAVGRRIRVPASVAALGALAFNDRVSYAWFAPAGFNRAALDFVKNAEVRLTVPDRDRLYDSRINPIATFPKQGFVIFGQKTLQIAKSALDRINVRRLLLEVKRIISDEAKGIVFEQNTQDLRTAFVARCTFRLGLIQARAGIEQFSVVANESNNGSNDEDLNQMNGRIVIVPTRSIEVIVTNFVVTNSGVSFV